MSLFEAVVNYIKGKEKGDNLKAPEGVCPNCWGEQEFDNKIREIVKDRQINVNSGRENYAFIQEFVVNHIDGIQLRNSIDGKVCKHCKKVMPG